MVLLHSWCVSSNFQLPLIFKHIENGIVFMLQEEIVPKNILMIGPTGCGKTEIARRLAKLADAPFVKVCHLCSLLPLQPLACTLSHQINIPETMCMTAWQMSGLLTGIALLFVLNSSAASSTCPCVRMCSHGDLRLSVNSISKLAWRLGSKHAVLGACMQDPKTDAG